MKSNVIILTRETQSHITPAMYLADLLSANHNVTFLVESDKYVSYIEENGFSSFQLKSKEVGHFAEFRYVMRDSKLKTVVGRFLKLINIYYKNHIFYQRQVEISEIIVRLNPSLVLIDLFASTNVIFFHSEPPKFRIIFFSPMLSAHPYDNSKSLNEGNEIYKGVHSLHKSLFYKLKVLLQIKIDELFLRKNCRRVKLLKKHPLKVNYPFIQYYFKNIPELIMAPQELELGKNHKRLNQYYLGLCTFHKRKEKRVESGFDILAFKKKKIKGNKIIFCSFGTYFKAYENHVAIATFLTDLITAFSELSNVELIIAVNQNVITVLKNSLPNIEGVHMFDYVPQLEVLQISDIFINHGGLGSIKEGIDFEVPMLVCPLDFRWDNIGNAYKVHYHGLGMESTLRNSDPDHIRKSLEQLLSDKKFRENLRNFNKAVKKHYNDEANLALLMSLTHYKT